MSGQLHPLAAPLDYRKHADSNNYMQISGTIQTVTCILVLSFPNTTAAHANGYIYHSPKVVHTLTVHGVVTRLEFS